MRTDALAPLRHFVVEMTRCVGEVSNEPDLLAQGKALLSQLIAHDHWLPEEFAKAKPDTYAQYLLHCDPMERFSVVSFVWGPGHCTPVHDHTVWGLVGILRGAERCEEFAWQSDQQRAVEQHCQHLMHPGDIDVVSPTVGDWHRVSNALDSGVSVSIHVYGANIGAVRRHRMDDSGRVVEFVSGYTSAVTPNIWDRSAPSSALPPLPPLSRHAAQPGR